jgi:hypothetical protein
MKHTYDFRLKGFKGNIRGDHIHAPFTTLEEMLLTLPEALGIDIELSNDTFSQTPVIRINLFPEYPMLWEAEDWKMDLYGAELNKFVDATLDQIYTLGGRRNIIFTSFSPELCILNSASSSHTSRTNTPSSFSTNPISPRQAMCEQATFRKQCILHDGGTCPVWSCLRNHPS